MRKRTLFHPILFVAVLITSFSVAPSLQASGNDQAAGYGWAVLGGYGESEPDWGETTTRVQTVDLVLRRQSVLFDNIGTSWYRGFHSLLIELPFHFLPDYEDSPMIGLNFLACYTFTSSPLQPYFFGGGGPVYTSAEIPGLGAELNGNYQFGGGISYDLDDKHSLLFEARYHHISNGGAEDPNDPLNSWKILIGYTF